MSEKSQYYVELYGEASTRFEKVDEYVFKNRTAARNADGSQRYSTNWLSVVGGVLAVQFVGQPEQLGAFCRMLAVQLPIGVVPGGLYREPTHVHFKRGNSQWLYETATTIRYKRAA